MSEKFFGAFEKFFENLIFCFYFFENFSLISPIFTKIRPQQLAFQPILSRSFVLFLHCSFLILVLTPFRIRFSILSLTFHHTDQCSASLSSTPLFIFPLSFNPAHSINTTLLIAIQSIPVNPHYSLQSNPLQSTHTTHYNPAKPHPLLDFPLIPSSTIPIPLHLSHYVQARTQARVHALRITLASRPQQYINISATCRNLIFATKKTPTEAGVSCFCSKTINALRIEVPYELCGDRISYVLLLWGHV